MKGFLQTMIVLGLISLCLVSLLMIRAVAEPAIETANTAKLTAAQRAEPVTDTERMFSRQSESSEKAYAALVAVAVSGDTAQVGIVRAFTGLGWSLVISLGLAAVIIYLIKFKSADKSKVSADDFETESQKIR